jgi:hypothetical protein
MVSREGATARGLGADFEIPPETVMNHEPESPILQMLREMRAEIANIREDMATKNDVAEIKSDMVSLRADVAADLITTRKDLGEQIVGLRRAVIEYHTSVIGHGILISDLEARVRRVEQDLNLPALDAH